MYRLCGPMDNALVYETRNSGSGPSVVALHDDDVLHKFCKHITYISNECEACHRDG